ncbi:primase-helicase family protein [Acidovorax sp. T1m]|uniref:primase-helicase family protein n=1 Tax=Acidovorax sp. T1m TaxID=2006116 RepID=UPI000B3FAEC1|nr:primase-helicase family protein [Acidovorax sp. T1m]
MNIIFLEASVPLTKTYSKSSGAVVKTPYPFVWEFTSHSEPCKSLVELEHLLKTHAALGHCALKGSIARPLVKESRAGSTDTNSTTEWLVLDLDGLPETIDLVTPSGKSQSAPLTIDLFLAEMGLADISYIVQYSASYGIENQRLRAHIFMLLDKPYAAPLLKQWLIQKNHEVPLLHGSMGLTKTGNSISWPLDISACQNDKLIYIAPPVLKGIKDPMGKTPRISYVKRKHDKLSLNGLVSSSSKNKELNHKRIADLREESGLPARKITYKMHGSTEVMLKPDECIITEMKTERGFVYFNLNGGDSWAYYHPENAPDYILNFKGEPAYLTKELLPDYWQQLTGTGSSTRVSSNGLTYLAFLDRSTGVYWRGTYDAAADLLDITPAKNETQLRHFAKQYGVPMGDFVPEWDLTFDPTDMVRVDVQNRTVNKFQPTQYMLNAGTKSPKAIPKTIHKVIWHALGGEQAIFDHYINWLATIVQTRDRTRTAWVLHGTEGTGKGVMVGKILRPLFGGHVALRRMEELNEKYNQFMQNSFLVFVDEVQTKALQNEQGVMAKLRNFITEDTIPIRAMYSNDVIVHNYTNWIFSSNMSDPVSIKKGDRRFNVGKYQSVKLQMTDSEIDGIEKELQAFYDYLVNYPADFELAGQIIQTADRDTMISISESSIDTVGSALLEGNFDFFIEQLPTDNSHLRNALQANKVKDYEDVLRNAMARTQPSGDCAVAREELRTLFDFTVGGMPTSPNKFTSLLKHHRIHMDAVWVNNKTVRGIKVRWKDMAQFPTYLSQHLASPNSSASSAPTSTTTPKLAGKRAPKAKEAV